MIEVLVTSVAGKPIFHSDPDIDPDRLSSLCAFVQATVANYSMLYDEEEEMEGQHRSYVSFQCDDETFIGVWTVKNLVFIAVCRGGLSCSKGAILNGNSEECTDESLSSMQDRKKRKSTAFVEAYVQMLLEYMYGVMLFIMTDQLQLILDGAPNFDLTNILGRDTEVLMRALLEESKCSGAYLSGAVEVVTMDPDLRHELSTILKSQLQNQALYSFLILEGRVLCFLQPRHRFRLSSSDIHLIVNFVKNQPGLKKTESW